MSIDRFPTPAFDNSRITELEWLIAEWRKSAEPFSFLEIAEVLRGTVHDLLIATIGDEILSLDRLVELYRPVLGLHRHDAADVLRTYLSFYASGVSVSPTDLVAAHSTILHDVQFRHVLTETEARTERLEYGIDLMIPADPLHTADPTDDLRLVFGEGLHSDGFIDGPTGWLLGAQAGDSITLALTGEGSVVVGRASDGDPDRAIDAFRAIAERLVDAQPVSIFTLFDAASIEAGGLGPDIGAPLTEILVAAGWMVRHDEVARADFDWDAEDERRRRVGLDTVMFHAGVAGDHMTPVIESLINELFGDGDYFDPDRRPRTVADRDVDRVAGLLSEPGVAGSAFTLSVGPAPSDGALDAIVDLADSLIDRTRPHRRIGPARLGALAAVQRRRTDDLVRFAPMAQLDATDDVPLCSIAGDLALDRGDLATAAQHYWRARVELSENLGALLRDARFGDVRIPTNVGRNEPCPCRSGRKFKRCHGGPDGPPRTYEERGRLLIARLGRHELRQRDLRVHRLLRVAGVVGCDGWMDGHADSHAAAFVETLPWFEGGGLAYYLATRGSLLSEPDLRFAESWLDAPIVFGHWSDDGVVLSDGRVVEEAGALGSLPFLRTRMRVGRLVPMGDRLALIRAVYVPPFDDAEALVRAAGDDIGHIARAIGELRGREVPATSSR